MDYLCKKINTAKMPCAVTLVLAARANLKGYQARGNEARNFGKVIYPSCE
jgi:hypothetical protein